MSKESAVQPVTEEVKTPEALAPETAVVAETSPSEPAKPADSAASQAKPAAKPKLAKKAATAKPAKNEAGEKPARAPKSPAKAEKKLPAAAEEKAAEAPQTAKAAKTPKAKIQAPKKPKLVRDSFTIPETDYALFASIKQRALSAGIEVKKGEILRAALVALAKLEDAELLKAIGLIERIKTGRPKK